LPCVMWNIMVNDVQGVREMLVGQVLVSMLAGLAAMVATAVLSAPLLVTLVVYPVVSSLTLLLMAALWNIRAVNLRPGESFLQAEA
jgi:membrane protein implicated in regulation of membrane protease activity